MSFYGCSEQNGNAPCDPGSQWFVDRVVAVELSADPRVLSLAHDHFGDADYFSEVRATVNRDFTRVLFVSTWESADVADVSSSLITLPPSAIR